MDASDVQTGGPPPWLAPVLIIALVLAVILGAQKRKEVAENPIVDLLILTVGVFAFAHVGRWAGARIGAPGLSSFFGANYDQEGQ